MSIYTYTFYFCRNESEYINAIVDRISDLLNKTDLFISDNPVGIQSRVKDVINCLDFGSNGVQLVGMWGMGGVGKTTIAKAVYNKIGREFEGRSFLANIREVWKQDGRQIMGLQEQLLSDICKEKTKISYIDKGKNTLKDKLCGKRVLIVLDDVSTLDQLNTFCGSHEWFGKGSVIIITTRDLVLLRGRVNRIYIMTVMNESESIELFSWNAFKQARPKVDFSEISMNVVKYSGGLPLALEVLGRNLFARGVTEWQCVLEKLKRIPNAQVQKKLRISYDDLEDADEQEIFLDIACFLIGMDRNDVILILNGCGLHAEIGISVLVERSLVSVDDKNRLGMHDLLRDMGRGIVREESPKSPEKRSRLLYPEDVIDVLSKQTGEESVMGLALKLPKANEYCKANENFFSTDSFEKMKGLRLLQLAEVKLDGDFRYVSRELRLLSWNGLSHIPENFTSGKKLVSIKLENANVHLLWNESMFMRCLKKLKVLNLSHSHNLTESPDFLKLPNLEKIVLKDCRNLTMVSYSIVFLNRVLLINLQDCVSLCSLPRNIYKLKSLKTLILSGCEKLDKLEEDLEQMESLTTLLANETAIKKVPFSIFRSKTIWYISLCGYEGLLSDVVPSMIWSWMSPTSALSYLCQRVVAMSFIVSLDIHIPHGSSSQELSSRLKSLQLSKDGKIILDSFYATHSKDLTSTSATSPVSKDSLKYDLFDIGMNCQNTNNLTDILQNMNVNGCLLPGDNYPNWLNFNCQGSSVTFKVPVVKGRMLKSIMICIVYSSTPDNIRSDGPTALLVKNHTKATIQFYKRGAPKCRLRLLSSIEPGNKVEVAVVYENNFIVEQTFLYLVYDEPDLTSYRKKKNRVE
ncbi:disease resistance protein RUN1-like [Medicago truncatula]|uniref:disease resistance protein RUN1-like n=1 Tax=Medicago truncatula TaxID=3880 RepID=UPI0019686C54|nr:disease resistance protein RUN1-like [Medicago truncatula]